MWFPLLTKTPLYTPLTAELDEEAKFEEHPKNQPRISNWNILLLLTASFASVTKEPKNFSYNRDFSYPPSNATDAAWNRLFPGKYGGGFFNHPDVEGERATLSVLHQLHCLVGSILPVV
ncbi:hypothetical protein SBOR_7165 [Sclerotinia borealis F-4128]|uniref:Uncharacterized protein n=1 Tax=Sclerotinia borealis (strain F-4128) TaxID=1432307 RepID=W9C9H9_SCLBF|nr:hypothetical protein SBOR_7165 [Sclerotinia borealis F-4128]